MRNRTYRRGKVAVQGGRDGTMGLDLAHYTRVARRVHIQTEVAQAWE